MNEYLSKVFIEQWNDVSIEVAKLISDIFDNDMQRYVCAAAGLDEFRLTELSSGIQPSVAELIALCSIVEFLEEQDGKEELESAAIVAKKIRIRWFGEICDYIISLNNIVDSLVEISDEEDEESFLNSYHFFFDASSLCSPYMPAFLDKLLPGLCKLEQPLCITVPQAVIDCLSELSTDSEQAELSGSKEGMTQLKRIQDAGLLSVRGDEGDSTLMSIFLSALSRFKPRYHIVLLTQDETLANAVRLLNVSGVEGDDILIASLGKYGIVKSWFTLDVDDKWISDDEDLSAVDLEDDNLGEEDDSGITSEADLERIVNISNLLNIDDESIDDEEEIDAEFFEEEKFDCDPEDAVDFAEISETAVETFHPAGNFSDTIDENEFGNDCINRNTIREKSKDTL